MAHVPAEAHPVHFHTERTSTRLSYLWQNLSCSFSTWGTQKYLKQTGKTVLNMGSNWDVHKSRDVGRKSKLLREGLGRIFNFFSEMQGHGCFLPSARAVFCPPGLHAHRKQGAGQWREWERREDEGWWLDCSVPHAVAGEALTACFSCTDVSTATSLLLQSKHPCCSEQEGIFCLQVFLYPVPH